jgi:hypothetical protein
MAGSVYFQVPTKSATVATFEALNIDVNPETILDSEFLAVDATSPAALLRILEKL